MLLKSTKKVVFNVSELYYNAAQRTWCVKPRFYSCRDTGQKCGALGINGFRTFCWGLGKDDFEEKPVLN